MVCGRQTFDGLTHPRCRGGHTIDGSFASVIYKGVVRKLLHAFKYKPYVSDLRKLIADLLYEGLIQQEEFVKALQQDSLFVPIPLHASRLKERGYNQSEILARELARQFNVRIQNLLQRVKKTTSQVGLKRGERVKNLKDAFVLSVPSEILEEKGSIFLVDDVLTTGSTFSEAAKVLKKAGARHVWGIALARD